ncbi:MAG: S8 family peptidase [Thermoanaerobaculia bacterium]
MNATTVLDLRSIEAGRLTRVLPPRPLDIVIVKLRTTQRSVRRLAAAAGLEAEATGVRQPILASLMERGYVSEIVPVFPAPQPFAEGRGPARALAAAVLDSPVSLKRARGLCTIRVDRGTNADALAEHLNQQSEEVEYAYVPPVKYPFFPPRRRKSRARKAAAASNDPLASRQWSHGTVRVHQARASRGFVEADGILVAVVDSGIDREHPDLDGAVEEYVNFHSATEDDRDYVGHGTHVAGIIAAEINNRVGIAGLCAARLLIAKGLPRAGTPWNADSYYKALAYPIDRGAKVVNLSLGGAIDPGERDIIADLLDAGIVVVAAMGNEFEQGNPIEYPAAYDGVIAVGASDEIDRRASFSCTGAHIALVAPGVNILSTVPRYPSEFAQNLDYDSWPGTSMATPHVSAAVALLLAKSPGLSPSDVRKRIMDTADHVPGQTRRNEEYGSGRLNIASVLA